jgi:aminoglycoside 3'-phosphotransferase II
MTPAPTSTFTTNTGRAGRSSGNVAESAIYSKLPTAIARYLRTATSSPIDLGKSRAHVSRWVRGSDVFFLKRATANAGLATDLREEFERLSWLRGRIPVPEIVFWEPGHPGQTDDWLLACALPGIDAATAAKRMDAEIIVRALAEGFETIHAIEAADCPFNHDAPAEIARAATNVSAGVVDESDFDEQRQG